MAFDSATPNLQGQSVVYIQVLRNENRPVFSSERVTADLNSTYPIGWVFETLQASDSDHNVRKPSKTANFVMCTECLLRIDDN